MFSWATTPAKTSKDIELLLLKEKLNEIELRNEVLQQQLTILKSWSSTKVAPQTSTNNGLGSSTLRSRELWKLVRTNLYRLLQEKRPKLNGIGAVLYDLVTCPKLDFWLKLRKEFESSGSDFVREFVAAGGITRLMCVCDRRSSSPRVWQVVAQLFAIDALGSLALSGASETVAISVVMEDPTLLADAFGSFDVANRRLATGIFEFLATVLSSSREDAIPLVREALAASSIRRLLWQLSEGGSGEALRDDGWRRASPHWALVHAFDKTDDSDMKYALLLLIVALTAAPSEPVVRVALRNKLNQLGLTDALDRCRDTHSLPLRELTEVFEEDTLTDVIDLETDEAARDNFGSRRAASSFDALANDRFYSTRTGFGRSAYVGSSDDDYDDGDDDVVEDGKYFGFRSNKRRGGNYSVRRSRRNVQCDDFGNSSADGVGDRRKPTQRGTGNGDGIDDDGDGEYSDVTGGRGIRGGRGGTGLGGADAATATPSVTKSMSELLERKQRELAAKLQESAAAAAAPDAAVSGADGAPPPLPPPPPSASKKQKSDLKKLGLQVMCCHACSVVVVIGWSQLPTKDVKSTVFASVVPDVKDVDDDELQRLFGRSAAKNAAAASNALVLVAGGRVSLLALRRANNIAISLNQFSSAVEAVTAVRNLSLDAFNAQQVRVLEKIIPTEEEARSVEVVRVS
jgi:hypothetical protein